MSGSLLEEKKETVAEMMAFLAAQVQKTGFPITLGQPSAVSRSRFLRIPARVNSDADVGDKVDMLQAVEDAWNDRDPEPEVLAFLVPAGAPIG